MKRKGEDSVLSVLIKSIFIFFLLLQMSFASASQNLSTSPAGSGSSISLDEYLKRPDAKFDLKPTDNMGIRVVGNAGDFHAAQFRQIAIELHRSLVKKYPAGLTPIDLDAFEKNLDANVVFVDADIMVNGNPRVAANVPSAKLIVVNRQLWKDEDDPRVKLMFVFHEFLGLMNLDLNHEISSYFLTNTVLPGIIISLVSYQLSDYSEQLDKDEARLNCYRNQLLSFGKYFNESFFKGKNPERRARAIALSQRDLDYYFLISEEKLSSVLTFKKYIRFESLQSFLGIRLKQDGSFHLDSSVQTRGFQVQERYCGQIGGGPGCRLIYLNYLKNGIQMTPQCQGVLEDLAEPLKEELQRLDIASLRKSRMRD